MLSTIALRLSKIRSVITINWFFMFLRSLVISCMSNISRRVRDVAFFSEEPAEQLFDQTWNQLAIIDIAGCDAKLLDFASIIDHQVQHEAKVSVPVI